MTESPSTPDQAGHRRGRAAVPLSLALERALARYTGLSQLDERWAELGTDDATWGEFRADLKDYALALGSAMSLLPETPKRGATVDANELWSRTIPVQESQKVFRRLAYIHAMGRRYREDDFTIHPSELLAWFKRRFSSGHARFERLDRWLYRRTPKGRTYQKSYDASPQARARRHARNTPEFRAHEAERKRQARAASKALTVALVANADRDFEHQDGAPT